MLKEKSIAIVFTAEIVGGHELMTVTHIKKYLKKGFSVSVYAPKNNVALIKLLEDEKVTFATHNVEHKKFEVFHSFFNFGHLKKAKDFLESVNALYDKVIIVQGDIELGGGFIRSAKFIKMDVISYIPYAHSFKKMGGKFGRLKDVLAKYLYKECCEYITISDTFKVDLLNKNTKANVKVIRNTVPKPPIEEVRGVGYKFLPEENKVTILMAGRVSFRQKGQDKLLTALENVKTNKNIEVKIIGDGPDMATLKKIIKNLPQNIVITLLGWRKNIWEFAEDVDFVVIPSSYEGVPLVMLEALKRNITVIAPARDGMLDYLPVSNMYKVSGDIDEVISLREKIQDFT